MSVNNQLADGEIFKEEEIVRPLTTTRQPIKITVSQRVIDGEIAMSTALLSDHIPTYYEKPDILEDVGMALIRAAGVMRKRNKKVRNGK